MKGLIDRNNLVDIANAIRDKTGENGLFYPNQMADKILSIETGGGGLDLVTSLSLDVDETVTYDKNVIATATLMADYDDLTPADIDLKGYLKNATVLFYDSNNNLLGTGITNVDGVAICNLVLNETTTIHCVFNGTSDYNSCISNSISIDVIPMLFYDKCDSDNTAQYTLQQIKGSANATLTFNSNEQAYLVYGTSTERAIYTFGDTTLQNGIKISADIKLDGANWYRNGMLGWFDSNNPQNNYIGGFAQGETYYRLMEFVNNVEATTPNNRWSGLSTSDYNHHELTYNNGIIDYTITNPQGVSKTVTLNQRMDWIGSRIGLFIETNRYDLCYIKNIKVEEI